VLHNGDAEARSLISSGRLEDLTSLNFYRGKRARPIDFMPWLGPRPRHDAHIHAVLEERLP
jgi:hypothetical protein